MKDSLLGITALNWILAVFAIIGMVYAGWRTVRPAVRLVMAAIEAILGTEPVKDRGGKVIAPAQPGLVHRVTSVEEAVVEFRHMVGLLTEVQGRLDRHDERLRAIELASVERIVTKAESAAAWQAIGDKDLIDSTADEPDLD